MAEMDFRAKAKHAADRQRPQYHFLPPAHWMNDPNGVCQWQGQYHLFYQYNPHGPQWGWIHWGHAVSDDLVYWRDLPVALAPSPGTGDQEGCWSGCLIDDRGTPTVIYTGIRDNRQLPCLATSSDGLVSWQKYPANPIIAGPPPEMDVLGFRDHCVWRDGTIWYQLIGSGIKDIGGTALLYRSYDLRHWEYMHPICIGDKQTTGEMWECPDLFLLSGKAVLLISPIPLRKSLYLIGIFAEHFLSAERQGVVDFGGHFYAPQTFQDEQGRRIMWGWLWEGRSREAQIEAGWAGVMSLPRLLSVLPGGTLCMEPAPELQCLRGTYHRQTDLMLTPSCPHRLAGIEGDSLELIAEFDPGDAQIVGVAIRCSPDGQEQTRLIYEPAEHKLSIDRSQSSIDDTVDRTTYSGQIEQGKDPTLRLHIFIDHSVVELFINKCACATTRIYPARQDSTGITLFVKGGSARLIQLDSWEIGSIWSDQRETVNGTPD